MDTNVYLLGKIKNELFVQKSIMNIISNCSASAISVIEIQLLIDIMKDRIDTLNSLIKEIGQ